MNTEDSAPEATKTNAVQRTPLGCRDRDQVNETLLRVVGKPSKVTVLDVAAFQSFIE